MEFVASGFNHNCVIFNQFIPPEKWSILELQRFGKLFYLLHCHIERTLLHHEGAANNGV